MHCETGFPNHCIVYQDRQLASRRLVTRLHICNFRPREKSARNIELWIVNLHGWNSLKRGWKRALSLLILLDLITMKRMNKLSRICQKEGRGILGELRSWIEQRNWRIRVLSSSCRGRSFLSKFLQDEFTPFLFFCGPGIIPYPKTKYCYAGEH
jgi:hypothetical protein